MALIRFVDTLFYRDWLLFFFKFVFPFILQAFFHMAGVEKCMHAFHGYNFHYYTSYTFQYIVSVESLKIKDRQGRIGNKAAEQSLRRLLYHLPATFYLKFL